MEEILASIKRIIAEDGDSSGRVVKPASGRGAHVIAGRDEKASAEVVLELTDPVKPASVPTHDVIGETVVTPETLISEMSVQASRHALDALSAVVVHSPDNASDSDRAGMVTLDTLVADMLRPMLKQWLDQHLPEIVERMVQREIARITGKKF